MKCDNCRGYNAKVVIYHEGEEKQYLCPKCRKILERLEQEFKEITSND